MKIYKAILRRIPKQTIIAKRILSIQKQQENLCVWYETAEDDYQQTIYLIPTGMDVPEGALVYMSTVQDGPYVWHFYVGI